MARTNTAKAQTESDPASTEEVVNEEISTTETPEAPVSEEPSSPSSTITDGVDPVPGEGDYHRGNNTPLKVTELPNGSSIYDY